MHSLYSHHNNVTLTKEENMSESSMGAPASTAPISASGESSESEASLDAEEAAIDDSNLSPEDKKEAKKEVSRKKKYSLKVNGKSKDVELDLDNDEEIQKYLQKAAGADEKFQEAAMTRKQAEQLVEMLRTNPLALLRHPELGIDVKALAEQVMNEEIESLSKSPEQVRIEQMEKQLKDYEEEKKHLESAKREAEIAKLEEQAYQGLNDQMIEALATTSLPKTEYIVKRITDAMIDAVGMGYIDVTAKDVMPYVEEQFSRELQKMFEASPDEVFEKLVGKERITKYRKAKVASAKAKPIQTAKQVQDTGTKSADKKSEAKPMTFKELYGKW